MRGKGVVVEIAAKNRVIVMTSRGDFVRVPCRRSVSIGQEISFAVESGRRWMGFSAAALLLITVIAAGGWYQGLIPIPFPGEPEFYVTLEVNPSIELGVSRSQRVVAISGLNAEGEKLASEVSVVGRHFKTAVERITDQLDRKGFLQAGLGEILVTIATPDADKPQLVSLDEVRVHQDRMGVEHELEQAVRDTLSTTYHAKLRIWQVPVHVREDAAMAGLTPAHYVSVYVETVETPGEPTMVAATVEHQGRRQVFEFAVNRPVLTPASWSEQDEEVTSGPRFPTAEIFPATTRIGDSELNE